MAVRQVCPAPAVAVVTAERRSRVTPRWALACTVTVRRFTGVVLIVTWRIDLMERSVLLKGNVHRLVDVQ